MLEKIFKSCREEFIEFINHISDAVFVIEVGEGPSFRYAAVNNVGLQLVGLEKTIIGMQMKDVLPDEVNSFLTHKYRDVLEKKSSVRFEHKTRRNRIEESILNPILDQESNITHILSVTRDMTDRKMAECELKEYSQKYKSLVDYNPDAIYELDLEGNFTSINEAGIQFVGYHSGNILHHSFISLIPEKDVDSVLDHFRMAKDGIPQEFEVEILPKEGQSISCLIKNVPIVIDGKINGIFGIAKNVTQEKKLLTSLKESEERYRRLVDDSPDPIFIHHDGFIEYANNAAVRLVEVDDPGQLIGRSIYDFSPVMYRSAISERNRQMIEEDEQAISKVEEEIVTVSGRRIDVEVSAMPIIYKEKTVIHSVIRDVSERKKLEDALLESEERYRLIAENSTDLIKLLDKEGEILYASPSHEKILGQPPEHYVNCSSLNFVHQEEIPLFQNTLEKVINNQEVISLELRLPHMNGGWIWTSCDMIPILNEEEHVERILVVGEDITERKRYEEKIYHMAFHDSLTGLPNRQLFSDRVHQALARARRNQSQFAVMYLDCDHFKSINDELGHDAGDEFLKSLAGRLKGSIRESDTVARIGGDEFNILLPDIEDDQEVNKVAKRILDTVSLPWEYDEKSSFSISMSIGIASYPNHGDNVNTIIKKADQALYMAKESGRNKFKWYKRGYAK